MFQKILILFLTFFFFLTAAGSRGEAFVPQTPHLLHLVAGKIKEPAGLKVFQVRRLPRSAQTGPENTVEDLPVSLNETLSYVFPGKLRIEAEAADLRFALVSGDDAVRVDGGRVVDTALSPFDHYTDVLLYRDHESLPLKLVESGINTEKVTFQRLNGRICYLIGDPPRDRTEAPGLWIEKDSFFPVRYLMRRGQWMVDIRYDDWQRTSRTWYPMSVSIFVDGRAFTDISVSSVQLASDFPPEVFDVDRILRTLPRNDNGAAAGGHEDRVKDLDKTLEEFNKLYD